MIQNIETFLQHNCPLFDVRSPSEFMQGHIPGAHSFPLFTDEERAQIGTLYKREGKEAAVKLGLRCVGPKLAEFVEKAEKLADSSKTFRLYCWRGGMRSSSMAWLLETAGFKSLLLQGGYKTFRKWVLQRFTCTYPFVILGGFTGSGKTERLHQLKQAEEQVIDLEQLANHRGSSFGHLGNLQQPSVEQFENLLAWDLSQCSLARPIWLEDESRLIGRCCIPEGIWKSMRTAPFVWLQISREERLQRLCESYENYPPDLLIQATLRLKKKLGEEKTKQIIQHIEKKEYANACSKLLDYYDRTYAYSLHKIEKGLAIRVPLF